MDRDRIPPEKCIHCHICMNNCSFLSKYGLDIGDIDRLKEYAYHCFLCGECTRVCPIGIDGRAEILELRRAMVASPDRPTVEKRYKGLLGEKRNYKFRNYKRLNRKGGSTVFFPGCNFPSLYPKTAELISSEFSKRGIQTIYDCCGKPVSELGFHEDEDRIVGGIRHRLEEAGVIEIVMACPNCRFFLEDRLGIKVTGIYTKLEELGIGQKVEGPFNVFVPCPDRDRNIWIEELAPFVDGELTIIEGVQCCGLGGSAIKEEREIAVGFTEKLKVAASDAEVMTYCASCTGQFKRSGYDKLFHVLTGIMGTDEKPDTGKSYVNRVLTKFK